MWAGLQDSDTLSHELSPIHGSADEEEDHQALLQFMFQILRLQYLWDVCMKAPSFLKGLLNQMLK